MSDDSGAVLITPKRTAMKMLSCVYKHDTRYSYVCLMVDHKTIHLQVSILFMDIVGFTSMSKEVAPQMVMEFLNDLFSKFDGICDKYNVYKVRTMVTLTELLNPVNRHPYQSVRSCHTQISDTAPTYILAFPHSFTNLQVETAGDCYIVAGALMEVDEEGFMTLDAESDAFQGAQNVLNFAQVGKG